MTDRFVCIHGHFYQPPRENPWLEDVEVEDSAAPYHDWNERITAECYAPNAVSRILDDEERIAELVNNYEKISFNFGPTLLSWLERRQPHVYAQIIEADHISRQFHNGHGNAIAQCYNHAIMPLASERDKLIQVRWGIADFMFRFGREPEGMWLAETAVDLATLEVLAEHGIKFTILAPSQAQAVRAPGGEWKDVSSIDSTRSYRCELKSGRHIDLFFYDGPASHDISFENLLRSGDRFADRLSSRFDDQVEHAQLMNVATDGETFGHHFKFGDMALAYAIRKIEREGKARITNYGEYLTLHPPEYEVKIRENTSWSCAHGIERWRSDCGCNSGSSQHQRWRAPLRRALDSLRTKLVEVFEREASALLNDAWSALDDYIGVVLCRSEENREAFLNRHARRMLSEAETVNVWRLLEMQRHAALMYTSCGWFFDDIANIETVKIIEYAARSIQLAREVSDTDLESQFVLDLAQAPGNRAELSDGAKVYESLIKPSITDLKKGLGHYGISSLVEQYETEQRIFSFHFERREHRIEKIGGRTLALGRVDVHSKTTREVLEGMFAVVHLGGYDFHCSVRERQNSVEYEELKEKLFGSFEEGSTRELLQMIDKVFDGENFSLKDLFKDERRKIGRLLLRDALDRSRSHYQRIYEESRDVMRLLASMKIPAPDSLKHAAEYVLTLKLEEMVGDLSAGNNSDLDLREAVETLVREAAMTGSRVDFSALKNAIESTVHSRLEFYRDSSDESSVESALKFLTLADELGLKLDLWRLQNQFWNLLNHSSKNNVNVSGLIAKLADKLRFGRTLIHSRLTTNAAPGSPT
jgi:alpha-amylase/alpha-mannosidase (GH57 family)